MWPSDPYDDPEVRAALLAQDPAPEAIRVAEMVKQVLESAFWRWYTGKLQEEQRADVNALADPRTSGDMVNFLRGKLHARSEAMLLPQNFVRSYDGPAQDGAEEPEDIPPDPRPLAVTEDGNAGHPG